MCNVRRAFIVAVLEDKSEFSHRTGKLHVIAHFCGIIGSVNGIGYLIALSVVGILIAYLYGKQLAGELGAGLGFLVLKSCGGPVRRGDYLIQRGNTSSRAYLASVLGIVVEVLVCETAVVVADKTVTLDVCWIELNLYLNVLRNGVEGAAALLDKYLFSLGHGVYIVVAAVSVVGKGLHFVVLDIACTEAHYRQVHAAFALLLHKLFKLALVGDTYVQVAVGAEDNAVIAALNKVFFGNGICRLNAAFAVGNAVRFKYGGERVYGVDLVSPRARKDNSLLAGVGDYGNAVVFAKGLGKLSYGLSRKLQLVFAAHGAACVDKENQIAVGSFFKLHALNSHGKKLRLAVPRAVGKLRHHRKAGVSRGLCVVIVEVVEHFLNAHRVFGNVVPVVYKAAQIGVGGCVHVRGKGRQGTYSCLFVAAFLGLAVLLGVDRHIKRVCRLRNSGRCRSRNQSGRGLIGSIAVVEKSFIIFSGRARI